ncbi:MAG: SGNH/GDSL hydrolase family protein, partial [Gorillibacterium sp.]|nr:SGNH/GDSL hydrolase family protein [Gorillibacterium sp.]
MSAKEWFEMDYWQTRRGLPATYERLLQNEPLVIAFLGGSITEGAGVSAPSTSWRVLTEKYLQDRFPHQVFHFINAGVGGTNSTFGAHRLQEHVLRQGRIDLLFVEFSVNDGDERTELIRGMEGIVRQCQRLSSYTDICFLYTAADKNLTDILPFTIAVHEEVATHYGIPSVNFAARVYAEIKSGQTDWNEFAPDRYHPSDAGHARYAMFLQEYLAAALDVKTGVGNTQATLAAWLCLDTCNYEQAAMRDFRLADQQVGFELTELKAEPLMNWRYSTEHLYASSADASLSFTATGQSVGLLLLCGPDTGVFEYSVNSADYTQVNLFDEWCLLAFRPVIAVFPLLKERGSIQVTVRATKMKHDQSTGTS